MLTQETAWVKANTQIKAFFDPFLRFSPCLETLKWNSNVSTNPHPSPSFARPLPSQKRGIYARESLADHRAAIAAFAILFRRAGLKASARAYPPIFPPFAPIARMCSRERVLSAVRREVSERSSWDFLRPSLLPCPMIALIDLPIDLARSRFVFAEKLRRKIARSFSVHRLPTPWPAVDFVFSGTKHLPGGDILITPRTGNSRPASSIKLNRKTLFRSRDHMRTEVRAILLMARYSQF